MKTVISWIKLVTVGFVIFGCYRAQAIDGAYSLRVVETPSFIADSNGITTGGWLILRNASETPTNVSLRVTDFVNLSTSNHFAARMNLYDRPGGLLYAEQIAVPAMSNLFIWAQLSNISEAGESAAQLMANGVALTSITATRWNVPFNVSAVGLPEGTNELVCAAYQPLSIVLSNADGFSYKVHWELLLDGEEAKSGDELLQPNSQSRVGFLAISNVPSGKICNWFKDDDRSAELVLQWRPVTVSIIPSIREKIVRFHLRVAITDCTRRCLALLKDFTAISLLVLGAAGSWALNLTLPNIKRRGILGGEIVALADRTHSLSTQIDSSLRVLLRVQRLRFFNVLSRGTSWSPATTSTLDTVQAGIGSLDRQVTIVERIDRIYDVLFNMKAAPIAPTSLAILGDSINQASRLLRATLPAEADLQSAEALVKDAETRLVNIGKADDALALSIARRVKSVNSQLTSTVLIRPEVAEIRKKLPELLSSSPAIDPQFEQASAITADFYMQLDKKSRKLELLGRYIKVLGNLQEGDRKNAIKQREDSLMELLALEGYVNMQCAERLVGEMEEGIFPEGICEELKDPPRGSIEIGSSPVRLYEPVQFRVTFRKPEINSSTARNEFSYEWDFGDGLKEKGISWTVWHFFKDYKTEPYEVKVTIFGLKDGNAVATLTEQITVENPESKNFLFFSDKAWAETTRVALALLAPMLALVAGTREKILQQDTLAAAITIFLMGFTANAIKDMLIQSSETASAAPPKSA